MFLIDAFYLFKLYLFFVNRLGTIITMKNNPKAQSQGLFSGKSTSLAELASYINHHPGTLRALDG
jgi:hypothetical protein